MQTTRPRSIPRRANRDSAPLSFAQQRLWFLDQLQSDSPLYNLSHAVRLKGQMNVTALQKALEAIIDRHEALRTTFPSLDGVPMQVIAEHGALELPVLDLREWSDAEREGEVERLATVEVRRPFALSRGPLLRGLLLRTGEEEHVLVLTIHHIVSDAWSTGVFFRELATCYTAFCDGELPLLPELPIQYGDFAAWRRQWLQGQVLQQQLAYWKDHLAGAPARLEPPTDWPRPAVQSHRGGRVVALFPVGLATALKGLSRREGVTLFMTLLAAFQVLLARYTGQEDLVVGTPIAGRTYLETEGLIGFFVNTLPLRTQLTGDPTFRELLTRVREVALGAYAHQDLPFEKLVEELQPDRDLSSTPVFQVMFILQNAPRRPLELPGLSLTPLDVDAGTAKFDLTLSVTEVDDGLQG
ncbi:MAG: condensation domain-containing protein, partial [Candidatus Entotheonellia bacterium]